MSWWNNIWPEGVSIRLVPSKNSLSSRFSLSVFLDAQVFKLGSTGWEMFFMIYNVIYIKHVHIWDDEFRSGKNPPHHFFPKINVIFFIYIVFLYIIINFRQKNWKKVGISRSKFIISDVDMLDAYHVVDNQKHFPTS